jgi:NADPH-ferrihemoprotein reductase
VTALSNLTPGEERPIFELHLDNRKGLQYATGDHVAVFPQNPAERVAALCSRMMWSPDLTFHVEPSKSDAAGAKPPFVGTRSVNEVLSSITDLQAAISPNMLRVIATHASSGSERDALLALSDKSVFMLDVRAKFLTFLDLLTSFPSVRMPFDRFLSTCPLITPRYYSVSSSSKMFGGTSNCPPSELHITFRHVRNLLSESSAFQGLNTTYMATRRLGDEVHVAIRPSEFRLPADPATPVIMLGGGIGIAPFKAFLEERIHDRGSEDRVNYGKSLMLYGCRDENDQIMLSLMKSALRIGALTSFDVAYAVPQRPGASARMADALVLDHSNEIWEALQQGGIVYVCGGAKGFGQAVANSVRNIAEKEGGMTAEQSADYLSALLRKCQYVEDLAD